MKKQHSESNIAGMICLREGTGLTLLFVLLFCFSSCTSNPGAHTSQNTPGGDTCFEKLFPKECGFLKTDYLASEHALEIVTDNDIIYSPFDLDFNEKGTIKGEGLKDLRSYSLEKKPAAGNDTIMLLEAGGSYVRYLYNPDTKEHKVIKAAISKSNIELLYGIKTGMGIEEVMGLLCHNSIRNNTCLTQIKRVVLFHPIEEYASIEFSFNKGALTLIQMELARGRY